MKTRRTGTNNGFSIVETLIAMMVIGVTVTAVYGVVMLGFTTIRHMREQQRATQIMLDVLEMIRLCSWEQLETPGFVPSSFVVKDYGPVTVSTVPTSARGGGPPTNVDYHGTITLSDPSLATNYDTRLKHVRVDVVWNSAGMERKRQLNSYVTFGGLYSYLF